MGAHALVAAAGTAGETAWTMPAAGPNVLAATWAKVMLSTPPLTATTLGPMARKTAAKRLREPPPGS